MPRITAFMRKTDPGRISSVVISPLEVDRSKQVKKHIKTSNLLRGAPTNLYVTDCEEHPGGIATIPVVLMAGNAGAGWAELGVARCCPLCWKVLVPPEDVVLPPPKPNFTDEDDEPVANATPLRAAARTRTKVKRESPAIATRTIRDLMSDGKSFTVYDAMEWIGKSRVTTLKRLSLLEKLKEIEVVHQGGGPRNPTVYRKVLKKEKTDPNSDNGQRGSTKISIDHRWMEEEDDRWMDDEDERYGRI